MENIGELQRSDYYFSPCRLANGFNISKMREKTVLGIELVSSGVRPTFHSIPGTAIMRMYRNIVDINRQVFDPVLGGGTYYYPYASPQTRPGWRTLCEKSSGFSLHHSAGGRWIFEYGSRAVYPQGYLQDCGPFHRPLENPRQPPAYPHLRNLLVDMEYKNFSDWDILQGIHAVLTGRYTSRDYYLDRFCPILAMCAFYAEAKRNIYAFTLHLIYLELAMMKYCFGPDENLVPRPRHMCQRDVLDLQIDARTNREYELFLRNCDPPKYEEHLVAGGYNPMFGANSIALSRIPLPRYPCVGLPVNFTSSVHKKECHGLVTWLAAMLSKSHHTVQIGNITFSAKFHALSNNVIDRHSYVNNLILQSPLSIQHNQLLLPQDRALAQIMTSAETLLTQRENSLEIMLPPPVSSPILLPWSPTPPPTPPLLFPLPV